MSMPDHEFDELARVLRADAPRPDPAFAREMDRRMANQLRERGGFRLPRFRLALAPALAAVAALIAVVLAIALSGGDQPNRTALTRPAGAAAPAAGSTTLAGAGRKVEHAIRVAIAAPPAMVKESADRVGTVTRASGGYVVSSELSTASDGTRSGQFVVRIDSAQVAPALAQLARLGTVRRRSETSHDMTAPYLRVKRELGTAIGRRRAVAARMAGAQAADADRMRSRLRALSAQISALAARMHGYEGRVLFTTVALTVEQAPVR